MQGKRVACLSKLPRNRRANAFGCASNEYHLRHFWNTLMLNSSNHSLPAPHGEALVASLALHALISAEIEAQQGWLSFERFMQLALYTPEFRSRLHALVEQAEKSYAQSATTLLIYLDARRTYFDTLADYNDSLAKAAGARADLESAVGVPLDQLFQPQTETK